MIGIRTHPSPIAQTTRASKLIGMSSAKKWFVKDRSTGPTMLLGSGLLIGFSGPVIGRLLPPAFSSYLGGWFSTVLGTNSPPLH